MSSSFDPSKAGTSSPNQVIDGPHDKTYLSLEETAAYGQAPRLKYKLLSDIQGRRTYTLCFHEGDELVSGLLKFAQDHKITAAHFTGIGALSSVQFAWYDLPKKKYKTILTTQTVEALSVIGNIALHEQDHVVHTHVTLGHDDGSMSGGHLIHGVVSPTMEIFLIAEPTELHKKLDEASGLLLFDLSS